LACTEVCCTHCGHVLRVPERAFAGERLTRCLVCPCQELYVRKDFSQRLGLSLLVLGFGVSCIPWALHQPIWTFAILGFTALVDLGLYFVVGNVLECYRCRSQYRGGAGLDQHNPFDLETFERYRQEAARLRQLGDQHPLPS
jgi:hypothetical protein